MQTDLRQAKWDIRLMRVALEAAKWSKDPSTQVGCVIAQDNHIRGVGYNGFAPGKDDDPALYADREYKYKHVVHAECAASQELDPLVDGVAYVTFPPCEACCKFLIEEMWIRRIVARDINPLGRTVVWLDFWRAELKRSRAFAESKGVDIVLLDWC